MAVSYKSNNTIIVTPAEGAAGITAAVSTLNALGGGIVQLLVGTYTISAAADFGAINNITIQGMGEGTLLNSTTSSGITWQIHGTKFSSWRPCTNVTAGDTSVYTTTVGDAAVYLVGDRVILDIRTSDGKIRTQSNRVKTAGNGVTGEIQLEKPILFTANLTTAISGYRSGENLAIRNFKMQQSTNSNSRLIDMYYTNNAVIDGCYFDNKAGFITQGPLSCSENINFLVQNCRAEFFTGSSGLYLGTNMESKVLNNTFRYNDVGLTLDSGSGTLVQGNKIKDNVTEGMRVSAYTMEFILKANTLSKTGIRVANLTINGVIANNDISGDRVSTYSGISLGGSDHISIVGNVLQNSATGINGVGEGIVISGNTLLNCGNSGGIPIQVSSGTNCAINGNTIKGGSGPGITINTSSTRINASNNIIDGLTGIGIDLASASSNCLISGNLIYNCTGDEISVANTVSGCLVIGNNCPGGTIAEGTGSNTFANNLI